jgi:hypothetical protein
MYYIPSFTQNFFKSDYGTEFQDYKRIKWHCSSVGQIKPGETVMEWFFFFFGFLFLRIKPHCLQKVDSFLTVALKLFFQGARRLCQNIAVFFLRK